MNLRNDSEKGRRQGMGVGLGGRGIGSYRALDDNGLYEEAEGKITGFVAGRPIYEIFTGTEMM